MRDKLLLSYICIDGLFAITGGIILIFALTTKSEITKAPSLENVARDLILSTCPLNAAIANSVFVFLTFLVSIPAVVMPMTRGWLKLSGYMTVFCGLFTMIIGLTIWFDTLKTRSTLSAIWVLQPAPTQSLLQRKFTCCGYQNSTSPPFVTDSTCPNALVAAAQIGCISPFSAFTNNFLDLVFTGAFGMVGVDVLLVLSTAMLLKDRKEKERYRHIDEKSGAAAF